MSNWIQVTEETFNRVVGEEPDLLASSEGGSTYEVPGEENLVAIADCEGSYWIGEFEG